MARMHRRRQLHAKPCAPDARYRFEGL